MTDCTSSSVPHAAADKGHVESMRQLIEAGGMELVLLRDKGGQTALHIASDKGHEPEAAARMLIKAGGKELLFKTSFEGCSALHMAARSGHAGVAKELVG